MLYALLLLLIEKSPGLFLQAAFELLKLYPFARFTIIGSGLLMESLQELAIRLQISWSVYFTGWIGDQLSDVLSSVDIVLHPFLWPETFCISNIEVMSMEIPLITFAVGGKIIVTYVEHALMWDRITSALLYTNDEYIKLSYLLSYILK